MLDNQLLDDVNGVLEDEAEIDFRRTIENRPAGYVDLGFEFTYATKAEEKLRALPIELVKEPVKLAFDFRRDMAFDSGSGSYWVRVSSGWQKASDAQAKRRLKTEYWSPLAKDYSPEPDLDEIFDRQSVAFAGAIAGYSIGRQVIGGQQVLITEGARLITSKQGSFPTISQLLDYMFGKEQLPYVLGWFNVACWALHNRDRRPGQAIALAGSRDSFKSFFQTHLVTPLLGGRMARPYQYMAGATRFNGDLLGAEHLQIEDDNAHTDIASRRLFGEALKQQTVNEEGRFEPKHKQAVVAAPFHRVTISLNDDPDCLMILPPMDSHLADKIMLFKVGNGARPNFDTYSSESRVAFAHRIKSELPAFLHYVMHEFRIPEALKDDRFGVRAWHHPEIVRALEEATPEHYLLELIDSVPSQFFTTTGKKEWTGKAMEMAAILKEKKCSVHEEAAKLLSSHKQPVSYLKKLAEHRTDRVAVKYDTHLKQNVFTIKPPTK